MGETCWLSCYLPQPGLRRIMCNSSNRLKGIDSVITKATRADSRPIRGREKYEECLQTEVEISPPISDAGVLARHLLTCTCSCLRQRHRSSCLPLAKITQREQSHDLIWTWSQTRVRLVTRRAPSDAWSSRNCLRDFTFPAERFNSAADMQRESQTMLPFLCSDGCHDSQPREGTTTYSREMDTPHRRHAPDIACLARAVALLG